MSVFDWCRSGDHEGCSRSFEKFILDPKSNRVVYSGETVECDCRKRGCKCYTKPADRAVQKRKPRRKK